MKKRDITPREIGFLCIIGCQIMWGFLPIYWQALKPIDSWIIILYRIFTIAVFSIAFARMKYSFGEIFAPLRDRKTRIKYLAAGLVLTVNWSIYIWAINSGRVIQTSIGYYIEPLVICLFGIVLFKEKLTKYNLTAMLFALAAVILILVHFGQIPAVALGLALTWAVYSAVKKTADQPPLLSLVYETTLYGILAGIAIVYLEIKGIGGLSFHATTQYAAMWLSGLVSLIPIVLFATSAKKVSLLVIGLAQYISPTITLLCGIFLFGESIDKVQLIAFGIIWVGLAIFTIGEMKESHSEKNKSGYKVDNAIIMAAGFGSRSMPLSGIIPKGLFVVKGEPLIERQIRQIKEAGINEIIVVVGYMKEKFYYLQEKYGVILVENKDYDKYNNLSSLYAAQKYISNSYICCSDNYFTENVFTNYVPEAYYSCLYTEEYADEHCVLSEENGYIKSVRKGGEKTWYLIAEAFFSKPFSEKFIKKMNEEYDDEETRKLIWEDFYIRHISELPMRIYKHSHDLVKEFDTLEEIAKFDRDFMSYANRIIEENSKKADNEYSKEL